MLQATKNSIRRLRDEMQLPARAKRERERDHRGLPQDDPGAERVIDEGVRWLLRAQERSASQDGGVARHFSLLKGWGTSYPETTGYIVPTMIDYARRRDADWALQSGRRMLDWLVAIQLEDGAFQGGRIDSEPVVPVTFNTGQILIGLAAGAAFDEAYRVPMERAATWLAETLDDDGCWRRFATPWAKPGEKVYETHVAWGLFEAARVAPGKGYGAAGMANLRWALSKTHADGWPELCCLTDPSQPLTHTLGYFLRGVLEAYRYSEQPELLAAARRTADGLLGPLEGDGRLPGRLVRGWRPAVDWVCLTGSVQIAHCWLMLYQITGEERYRDAGFAANRFVRRTIKVEGEDEARGAVKGAFPVDGAYGIYQYLNWAVKFCVDSNLLEQDIRAV